jgi:hypothetical protein
MAYSKSIRESQVLEAQKKAADEERRETEAIAEAAAEAEAEAEAEAAAQAAEEPPTARTSATLPSSQYQHADTDDYITRDHPSDEHNESLSTVGGFIPDSPSQTHTGADLPPSSAEAAILFPERQSGPIHRDLNRASANGPVATAARKSFDSPTLGLPGSFPAMSPPADVEEPPMSAVSTTSDTTEFDTEPQTAPPVQGTPAARQESDSFQEPSGNISQTYSRSEYRYPFQESPVFDSSEAPDHHRATSEHHVVVPTIVHDAEYSVPGAFSNEAANGLGLILDIQPEQDSGVAVEKEPSHDVAVERLPFPRLENDGESECHTDVEYEQYPGLDIDDTATDACTENSDEAEESPRHLSQAQSVEPASSQRSSVCESIDEACGDDHESSTHSAHQLTELPESLLVPSMQSLGTRLSHQSTWTDMSVGSVEPPATASSSRPQSYDFASHGYATIYSPRMSGQGTEVAYSHSDILSPSESVRSSAHYGQLRLPELDTGAGFSIPHLSDENLAPDSAKIPPPDHEPPPIPTPATSSVADSRRPSSTFYEQSQYGSAIIEVRRDSNDNMSTTEATQSRTQSLKAQSFEAASIANSDGKSSGHVVDETDNKERHRLTQRRNVIKELVDTEAVFVRDMNIVEEIYKGTAEACPQLDDKTVKLIFRNTDEIIEFHTVFLSQLKEAVVKVYVPKGARSRASREDSMISESSQGSVPELNDARDREVSLGPVFMSNLEQMKVAHEGFLRNSDHAAKRLIQIQQDPTVKVWLNECNEVAKDLTAAWDLDSLLIKPMQRITKYPNLIITLLQHTPKDHPDRDALLSAKDVLETAIIEINKTKKNFELVGQIVGRKRKESDVKAGFARAFGKRVDKLQASNNRPTEDAVYAKLNEKFGDDYLRLQVVLRDVEFYTRQVASYVHEFLQYLSSIELVMRLQPGSYPELESKWVQFNISVRDLEKVALEEHLAQIRKQVIEPFELVIKAYGNPSLAMKKRQKRRVDYERSEQLKRSGKSVDSKLKELVEQYEALNDTLKKELPQLSALTENIGNICLGNFVNIQTSWYKTWKDKMKAIIPDSVEIPDLKEVVSTFQRDFPYVQEQVANIGMLNPAYKSRMSQSTTDGDEATPRGRQRPSALDTRGRGLSLNVDTAPSLPTPDFVRRSSGSFSMSPGIDARSIPSPHQYYYKDYYAGLQGTPASSIAPMSPETGGSSSRSIAGVALGATSTRPSTGWSHESTVLTRQSSDLPSQNHRDSSHTAHSSAFTTPHDSRRFSGLFQSALPLPDGPEESQRSSRASSRERWSAADGYNVLWLAASLFEFNIATTKHEAGYPYLIYQAGEIFDVIGEKGELWLAKNQDDETEQVGWIWSKHFAKLADS